MWGVVVGGDMEPGRAVRARRAEMEMQEEGSEAGAACSGRWEGELLGKRM